MTPAPTPAGPLGPGATLGVFGGGQLGRMFAQAARRLGYRTHVFATEARSPAGQVADLERVGELTDIAAITEFARGVDALTLEFENVPTDSVAAAEQIVPVRPGSHVLHTTQHRVREKTFLRDSGVPVGPFAAVNSVEDLCAAAAATGLPAVLKTAELGYDGKGQRIVRSADELESAWRTLGEPACVLEAFVEFTREVSMLVARSPSGEVALYGPIANDHANHILDVSVYPAPPSASGVAGPAGEIATRVANALDAVGLLCVEMFELADGRLLVNEIAPRPHNSGHLTIEGCRTSQFEQQVRAVCGLELGSTASVQPAAMANVLGDLWANGEPDWGAAEAAGATVHLYGKTEPRPGRKMGHLTVLADTSDEARERAVAAREAARRS